MITPSGNGNGSGTTHNFASSQGPNTSRDAIYEVERQKAKEREEWASDDTPPSNCTEGYGETNDEVADRIGIGSGANGFKDRVDIRFERRRR